MSKWVTFHWHFVYGVSDLIVHKDREAALKYFNSHCKNYFQVNSNFKAKNLPATYGISLRKYCGMSKYKFEKEFFKIEEVYE